MPLKQKKVVRSPALLFLLLILLTACVSGCTSTNKEIKNNNSITTSGGTAAINACEVFTVTDATSAYGSPMQRYSPPEGIVNEHDGTYKSYGCTYLTPDSTGVIEISIYRFGSSSTAREYYDKWNGNNSGVALSGYGDASYWGATNGVMGTVRGSDYINVEALVGQDGNQDKAAAAMTTILNNLK